MAKQADRAKARPVGAVAGQPAGLFVGLTTLDMIYLVRRPPGPDEKIVADDLVVAAGGPATGAAFAHLGGRATLVSAVGSGPLAAAARADLATLGIHHHDLRPGVPVLRFRQSWSTRRAGSGRWCRRTARCRAPCRALLAGADVVLVDGHQLDVAVNILGTRRSRPTGAGGAATSAGRPPVVFDDGSWKPRTERLLPHVDVALCGSAFRPPGVGVDPGEVLRYLLAHGPSFAAVTHGPGPVR